MAIHDFITSTLNLTSDSIQKIDAKRKEDHLFVYITLVNRHPTFLTVVALQSLRVIFIELIITFL